MDHPEEPYYGVYYTDSPLYKKAEFTDFLNGNVQPMVTEIAKENYNNLIIELSGSNLSGKINQVARVLEKLPSITHLHLIGPINSIQAAHLVQSMATSNVIEFKLRSYKLGVNGISGLIDALNEAQIPRLDLTGGLESEAIANLKFNKTALQEVTLYNDVITGNDYLTLFKNLHGSSVEALSLFSERPCIISTDIAKQIDFAQTPISTLDWANINFEPGALAHIQFAGSSIADLHLYSLNFSGGDLEALSTNLIHSNIKSLSLSVNAGVEISHLHLENTPIESLSVSIKGIDLVHLHLQGSNVKTLDLSENNLTDQDLAGLHLKNTAVQHLILDQNDITEAGVEILKDLIKDTSIIDVSINTQHFDWVDGAPKLNYKECIIVNEYVFPTATSAAIHLSDVLNDGSFIESNTPAQLNQSPPWLQPTSSIEQMAIIDIL